MLLQLGKKLKPETSLRTSELLYDDSLYIGNTLLITVSRKIIYNELLKQREISTIPRIAKYVLVENTEWKDIFRTAQIPIDVRTRYFQY